MNKYICENVKKRNMFKPIMCNFCTYANKCKERPHPTEKEIREKIQGDIDNILNHEVENE